MKHSEKIDKIAPAIVKANGEIENAVKGATNPMFKKKYADLPACLDIIREVYAKHELTMIQEPSTQGDLFSLRTIVLHSSGQMFEFDPIESTIEVSKGVSLPQAIGILTTYYRRYAAQAISGQGAEDNDGTIGDQKDNTQKPAKAKKKLVVVGDAELKQIRDLIHDTGADEKKLCTFYKVKKLEELPLDWTAKVIDALTQKAEAAAKSEKANVDQS